MNEKPSHGMKMISAAIVFGIIFFKFDRFMTLMGAKKKGRK